MQPVRATIPIAGNRSVQIDLDPSQYSQKIMLDWLQGGKRYEDEVVRVLESVLKPGDTFIDVGCHVGYFSLIAAALVGPSGYIWAADIDARNVHASGVNLISNGFRNFSVCYSAIGREIRECEVWLNADNDGGHALWDVGLHPYNQQSREHPNKERIWMRTLDQYFQKADLVKIDTEGAEYEVLRGAFLLLGSNPDCVVIAEINDFGLEKMGSNRTEVRAQMEGLGFRTFALSATEEPKELKANEWPEDTGVVFNVMFRR